MRMKELSLDERPRERLLSKGPGSLSDGELLAVLLRSGTRGASALDVARSLLQASEGKLGNLFDLPMESVCRIPGMGRCKAAVVAAALELGRRFLSEQSYSHRRPVVCARAVYDLMIPSLKALRHEECWLLCLSGSNHLIGKCRISAGGQDSTVMDIRLVTRIALEKSASGVILVHNHPGGSPRPSPEDVKQTESLHKALKTMKIDLLDHVIICDDSFYSFDEGRVRDR